MSVQTTQRLRDIRRVLLLPLLASGLAFAQQPVYLGTEPQPATPPPAPAAAQTAPANGIGLVPRGYTGVQIFAGDTVNVHVYDTPEFEENVRVSESGDIQLPLLGPVHVASLTPAQAARAVEDLLVAKNLMKHPSVVVSVTGYETELVSVNGEVNHPGGVQITTPRSAIDLITLSGGLTDLADRNILIRRKGSATDVVAFFDSNDPREAIHNDVLVYPGDTVIVPRVGLVYVLGDVGRPGGYPIDQPDSQMTLSKAVALAGSTNHTATPSNARLVHRSSDGGVMETKVNFSAIQKGKIPDIVMEPGDVLYIPFSYVKNALTLGSSSVLSAVAGAAIYSH